MKRIAVDLAIQIEEAFKGSICYFDNPPSPRATRPDRMVIIQIYGHNDLVLEVFSRCNCSCPAEFATEAYELLSKLEIQQESLGGRNRLLDLQFLPGDEVPISSEVPGFEGYAFRTRVKQKRKTA